MANQQGPGARFPNYGQRFNRPPSSNLRPHLSMPDNNFYQPRQNRQGPQYGQQNSHPSSSYNNNDGDYSSRALNQDSRSPSNPTSYSPLRPKQVGPFDHVSRSPSSVTSHSSGRPAQAARMNSPFSNEEHRNSQAAGHGQSPRNIVTNEYETRRNYSASNQVSRSPSTPTSYSSMRPKQAGPFDHVPRSPSAVTHSTFSNEEQHRNPQAAGHSQSSRSTVSNEYETKRNSSASNQVSRSLAGPFDNVSRHTRSPYEEQPRNSQIAEHIQSSQRTVTNEYETRRNSFVTQTSSQFLNQSSTRSQTTGSSSVNSSHGPNPAVVKTSMVRSLVAECYSDEPESRPSLLPTPTSSPDIKPSNPMFSRPPSGGMSIPPPVHSQSPFSQPPPSFQFSHAPPQLYDPVAIPPQFTQLPPMSMAAPNFNQPPPMIGLASQCQTQTTVSTLGAIVSPMPCSSVPQPPLPEEPPPVKPPPPLSPPSIPSAPVMVPMAMWLGPGSFRPEWGSHAPPVVYANPPPLQFEAFQPRFRFIRPNHPTYQPRYRMGPLRSELPPDFNKKKATKRKSENKDDEENVIKEKKKKSMSKFYPTKQWNKQDALKAMAAEKEVFRKDSRTLVVKFPEQDITRELVSAIHPAIEKVHFQIPGTARYCFIKIRDGEDAEAVMAELNKTDYMGQGLLSVEPKPERVPPEDSDHCETVDPYTLYLGNLPLSINTSTVKEKFPTATRIDIGFAQRMKFTRYAFIRYQTVEDSIDAFRAATKLSFDSRTLIVRFRRQKAPIAPPNPPELKLSKKERKQRKRLLEKKEELEELKVIINEKVKPEPEDKKTSTNVIIEEFDDGHLSEDEEEEEDEIVNEDDDDSGSDDLPTVKLNGNPKPKPISEEEDESSEEEEDYEDDEEDEDNTRIPQPKISIKQEKIKCEQPIKVERENEEAVLKPFTKPILPVPAPVEDSDDEYVDSDSDDDD